MHIFIRFSYHFFIVIGHLQGVFLSLIALIVASAAVVTHIEKMPFEDALYFSFITGLTIGYGDIVVKTPYGRVVAVFLGFIGVIFSGLMVAAALRAVEKSLKDMNII